METIKEKRYARITFRLTSPLMLGSGQAEMSDKDILRDSAGMPFIPGSSLAGILRAAWDAESSKKEKVFGEIHGDKTEASKLICYDARLTENTKFHTAIRDSVALDAWKTAKKGAKFDMEVLEPGVRFVTFLEGNDVEAGDWGALRELWLRGALRPGAKTTRGYGGLEVTELAECRFDLSNAADAERWLDFDMYVPDSPCWQSLPLSPAAPDKGCLTLSLRQEGGISVRKYSTKLSESGKESSPDFVQMTNADDTAVIPGTSWAGAFRHRMEEFLGEEAVSDLFGKVDPKNKLKTRSKIRFSESQIRDSKSKTLTRNKIDRFTGGAADTALFTEETRYGGTTELKIALAEDPGESLLRALAAAVTDLHLGLLAVGGLTAIGRGLFSVTAVNGKPAAEDFYKQVLDELKEALK